MASSRAAQPCRGSEATATELLEGILARDGDTISATTTREAAEAQLQDAVTRYADALASAATKVRVDLDEALVGPLPWLTGVPDEVADLPAWGPSFDTFDTFEPGETWNGDYGVYCRSIAGFRQHFGLDEFSIRDIDKYLWMVAKERRTAST